MWDLGNRGVLVLISVLSGCVFLYNVWGPILTLALSLFIVVYACYSLLVHDSILSPQTILAFEYLRKTGRELNVTFQNVGVYVLRKVRELFHFFKNLYQSRVVLKMNRYRKSSYQLSNDSYIGARSSPGLNLTGSLSPIPRKAYQPFVNNNERENNPYSEQNNLTNNKGSIGKYTSTPLRPCSKESSSNGGFGLSIPNQSPRKKAVPIYAQNHTLSRVNDTVFSPEGSPWGTSISPKMRAKAAGVKTVQTIAGPLLASTRYNIDPKIYADVTSPGLSTRLTRYASEVSGKLTHQSQYATGQFPKVNLNASPLPLVTIKSTKMRMPVTVRIAPPKERQKIFYKVCDSKDKTALPNVAQALKEISLKRHAPNEDILSELVKKQRTDGIFNDDFETLEEMMQKRPREDSSKSEEDISPQKRVLRPAKRTKIPSCYDVLNSLSSSIHVSSGVKRKANSSCSGTPDREKHFKLSDSIQTVNSVMLTQPQIEVSKSNKRELSEEFSPDTNVLNPYKKMQNRILPKGILKSTSNKESTANQRLVESRVKDVNKGDIKSHVVNKELPSSTKPENVTDKLFMKAEPQSNEKLKTLIQEQGNIQAKFTSEDVEEIRKKDIVNMRQTSMRVRLQSMFDAISGKAATEINPDVVIQAEEIKSSTSATASPTTLATLNSLTSTTNVNTSPIATSAVAPSIVKSNSDKTSTKHVTFTLTNTTSPQRSNSSTIVSAVGPKVENVAVRKHETKLNPPVTTLSTLPPVTSSSSLSGSIASESSTATSKFTFGLLSSSTTTSSLPNTTLTFSTPVASAVISLPSNAVSTDMAQPVIPAAASITSSSATISAKPIAPIVTSSSNNFTYNLSKTTEKSTTKSPTSSNFSFGSVTTITSPVPINTQSITSSPAQKSVMTSSLGVSTTSNTVSTTPSITSFSNVTSSVKASPSNLAVTTAPSLFSFGTNTATSQASKSVGYSFGPSAATVQKAPTFGNTTTTTTAQATSLFGNTTATTSFVFPASNLASNATSTPGFHANANTGTTKFGLSTTTSSFTFGSTSALSVSTNKSGFSFGTNATTATTSASTSTISFGSTITSSTPTFGTTTGSPAPKFGTTTSSNAIPMFGTTTSSATPTFGATSSNATPTFGTTSTIAPPTFGVPSTTAVHSFGATTTAPMFSSTTAAPLFGTTGGKSAFGGTSSSETTKIFRTPDTTAPPAFGSNIGTTAFGATSTTSNLFSGASTNVNTATTSSASSFGIGSNMFGQTKSPIAFGTSSTRAFGNTSNVALPVFGTKATTTSATFETVSPMVNAVAPTFGTPSSTTLAFGAQGSSATGVQGATASVFGSPPSTLFGAVTSPSAFGTTNTTTTGFASPAANTFGIQNTVAPTFDAVNNNTSGFSANITSPFGSQSSGSTFGASSSSAPAFGSLAGSSNINNAFAFGGGQTQSPAFAFGSGNAPNTAGGATPFQFGAAPPKPAGGFNFNPPSSTPSMNFGASSGPSFAASAPGTNAFSVPVTGGMFSIGSGSTASRPRASRQKKQR